jgi:hypothetical protein
MPTINAVRCAGATNSVLARGIEMEMVRGLWTPSVGEEETSILSVGNARPGEK